jgi:hypothetical protein
VQAGVLQGSPRSPFLFEICTSALFNWVKEYISAKGLSFVDGLGKVVTGRDDNQVPNIIETGTAKCINCTSRQVLQFDTAKMEAPLLTSREGHKKHLRPNLTAKIQIGNGFIGFNKQGTTWLDLWMDAHLMFKEHHNRCMTPTRVAAVRLQTLPKTYGVVLGEHQGYPSSLHPNSCTI